MGQSVSRQRLVAGIFVAGGLAFVIATCLQQDKASQKTREIQESRDVPAMTPEEMQAHRDSNRTLENNAADRVSSEGLQSPSFDLLEPRGVLGSGDFGSIELVEYRQSCQTFTMKKYDKAYIVKNSMQESMRKERIIHQLIKSPFVMRLHGCYNLKQQVIFLVEPCLGGELYQNYCRNKFHGSESHARYYVGSAILGLSHFHVASVVYRDLKPENCLLDAQGRLKISDMGLAKIISGKTFTVCGTPDYFSPEVISNKGHGFAVDWWCTGVLLFELLSGHPPFEAAYPMKIYQNVLKGIEKVAFSEPTKSAESLIKGLLRRDPSDRLPMKEGGINNLKNHTWYANFDWVGLEHESLAPPFVPQTKTELPATIDRTPAPYEDDRTGWADAFGAELDK